MPLQSSKKEFIAGLFIAAILVGFWTQARYPQLDEKAEMGERTQLSEALSFDVLIPVAEHDPLPKRVVLTTVNWANTNKQGMTFGIVLAAALLTFLRLVQNRLLMSGNRFINACIGTLIGAPLGVCVNCAAPIGKGMHAAGQRVATVLATMHSSPTFNIVVLTMLFSLFPLDFALIKIGVTALFILVIMPAALGALNIVEPRTTASSTDFALRATGQNPSWGHALGSALFDLGRNLWFIIRTTVPLMLLAGLLGAAVIELFPLERLAQLEFGLWSLLLAGIVGTLLPVPIAFDVVVTFLLSNAGLPIGLCMTLFFTLGIYSPYPFFIIGRDISYRLASAVFFAVLFTGIGAGLATHYWYGHLFDQALDLHQEDTEQSGPLLSKQERLVDFHRRVYALVTSSCAATYLEDGDHSECTFRQVTRLAATELDGGICALLDNQRHIERCGREAMLSIAARMDDPAQCEKTADYTECIDRIVNDRLNKTPDPRYCGILQDQNAVADCEARAVMQQVRNQYDLNLCNRLLDRNLQRRCRLELVKHYIRRGGPPGFCDQLAGGERQSCLDYRTEYLAVQGNDFDLCRRVNDGNARLQCTFQVVLKQIADYGQSFSLCESFGITAARYSCIDESIEYMAQQGTLEWERCRQIGTDFLQEQCRYHAAVLGIDKGAQENLCDLLRGIDKHGECLAHYREQAVTQSINQELAGALADLGNVSSGRITEGAPESKLQSRFNPAIPRMEKSLFMQTSEGIVVHRVTLKGRNAVAGPVFSKGEGQNHGIELDRSYSPLALFDPLEYSLGVAAGDYNNDGWTDLLFAPLEGPRLFRNQGDGSFYSVALKFPGLDGGGQLAQAALVDIDNDGLLDIYLGALRGQNLFAINDGRDFVDSEIAAVPYDTDRVVTLATAFADVNNDGWVDFLEGNWSFGVIGRGKIPHRSSRNQLFINRDLEFREQRMPNDLAGETLSALFSDLNSDNKLDLLVANDFETPDQIYFGQGGGRFRAATKADSPIPVSPFFSMSYDSADFNNDLKPDIFNPDMDMTAEDNRFENEPYCDSIRSLPIRGWCENNFFIKQASETRPAACIESPESEVRRACLATVMLELANHFNQASYCRQIPSDFPEASELCLSMVQMKKRPASTRHDYAESDIFQVMRNVLLVGTPTGGFEDRAADLGVTRSSWSWNSKFADLDNDEWQDIYIGNGFMGDRRTLVSNIFFHNEQGRRFTRKEVDFGLDDRVITPSYVYADLDNDGDLDVVSSGKFAPVRVFTNNEATNRLVNIELRDYTGNRYAIGAKIFIAYGDHGERRQMREIKLGGGFQSYDPLQAHFGLGHYQSLDQIRIVWPDGEETLLNEVFPADAKYIIERHAK